MQSATLNLPGTVHRHAVRADVQGLRGFAVVAVLAVHAWPESFRGGFVGVDMFFVLSGWLITGGILDAMARGQFRFVEFWRARALRLLPALCTVLAFSLVAALFCFPSEARQIGRHVAASALFATNIALWQEAGYFDAGSETKPLLHLWSLAIEEQFYLLWPLVLLGLARRRRLLLAGILLLLAASFLLNVAWVTPKAKATFFLLPTRGWELLIGAALAALQREGSGIAALDAAWRRLVAPRPGWLAGLGVAAIAAALLLLDKTVAFPGWWALLPTLGTALVLAAGPTAWFNARVLSHPVPVFYGSVSYALYLWHWPLLVFPVLYGWTLDAAMRAAAIAASVGLAALTTEMIERPLRFGPAGTRRVPLLLGVLLTLGAGGLGLRLSEGLVDSWPATVQPIARAELRFDFGAYRADHCFLDLEQGPSRFAPECAPATGGLLLWGDSHAASLYPGLAVGARPAQFTKARCPPVAPLPPLASRHCDAVRAHVLRIVADRRPGTVVLAAHWSLYAATPADGQLLLAGLRESVRELRALGVERIVVIGHLPTWTAPLPRLLLQAWDRDGKVPERSHASLDPRAAVLDAAVRDAVRGTGASFVSPMEALCNAAGCLVAAFDGAVAEPIAHDESHLTVSGSRALVARSAPLGAL